MKIRRLTFNKMLCGNKVSNSIAGNFPYVPLLFSLTLSLIRGIPFQSLLSELNYPLL